MRYYHILPLFCFSYLGFSESFHFQKKDKLITNSCAMNALCSVSNSKTENSRETLTSESLKKVLFGHFENNSSYKSTSVKVGNVVINEFMASNDVTAADQDGEYDDWLELYNNTGSVIDLSGYFLSDDPGDLTQWTFPEGTIINANGFLIVWVDDDEDQDGLHANFKLSASGESLILVDPTGIIVVDSVGFGEQKTDISYGRNLNGTGEFQSMDATFGEANTDPTSVFKIDDLMLNIYPNPASHLIFIEPKKDATIAKVAEIYDTNGTLKHECSVMKSTAVNVSNWIPGVYIIKIDHAYYKVLVN
jgi:hypothetical protein